MKSLHPLPQVIPSAVLPQHHMSPSTTIFSDTIEVISTQAEFGASTITLVDPAPTPTHFTNAQTEPDAIATRASSPESTHTPQCPQLTIAPDLETEEGEIVD